MPRTQAITTRLNIETGFDGGSAIENASKLMISLGDSANQATTAFAGQVKQSVNLDETVKKLQTSFQSVASTLNTNTKQALTQTAASLTNLNTQTTKVAETIKVDLPNAAHIAESSFLAIRKTLSGVGSAFFKLSQSVGETALSNFSRLQRHLLVEFLPGFEIATDITTKFAEQGLGKLAEVISTRVTPELLNRFAPALTTVAKTIADDLLPGIDTAAGALVGKFVPGLGGVTETILSRVVPGVGTLASLLGNTLAPGVGTVAGLFVSQATPALVKFGGTIGTLIQSQLRPLVHWLLGQFVFRAIKQALPALQNLATKGFNALSKAIRTGLLATLRELSTVTQTILIKSLNGLGTVLKGALLVSLGLTSRAFTTLNNQLGNVFSNALSKVGNFLRSSFNTTITATGSVLANLLSPQVRKLAKTLQNNFNNALFAVRANLIKLGNAAKVAGTLIRDQLAKPINEIRALHEEGAAVLGRYNTKVDELSVEARTALTPLVAFFQAFTEGGRELLNTQEVLERVNFDPLVDDISKVNDELRQLNLFGPPAAKEIGLVGKELQQLGMFAIGTVTLLKNYNREIEQQQNRQLVDDLELVNDQFRQLSVFGPPAAKDIGLIGKELQQLDIFAQQASPSIERVITRLRLANYPELADDIALVSNEFRQLSVFGPPAARDIGLINKELVQLDIFAQKANPSVERVIKRLEVTNFSNLADDISKVSNQFRQLSVFGPPAAKDIGLVGNELVQLDIFAQKASSSVERVVTRLRLIRYPELADDISKVNDEFRQLSVFGPPTAKNVGLVGKELDQLALFGQQARNETGLVGTELSQLSLLGGKAEPVINKVAGELRQSSNAARNASISITTLNDDVRQLRFSFNGVGDAVLQTSKGFVNVQRRTKLLETSFTQASNAIRKTATASRTAATSVGSLSKAMVLLQQAIPILSAVVLIERLRSIGATALTTLTQVGRLSDRLSLSATTLQRMGSEARRLGLSFSVVEGSMTQWLERVEEAQQETGEGYEVFKELGIAVRDASGEFRDGEDILFEFAKILSSLEDQQKATAVSARLMGDDGSRILPIFRIMTKEGRQVNEEFEAMTERGKAVSKRWTALTERFNDGAIVLVDKLIPAMNGIIDLLNVILPPMTKLVTATLNMWTATGQLVVGLAEFIAKSKELAPPLQVLTGLVGGLADAYVNVTTAYRNFVNQATNNDLATLEKRLKSIKEQITRTDPRNTNLIKSLREEAARLNKESRELKISMIEVGDETEKISLDLGAINDETNEGKNIQEELNNLLEEAEDIRKRNRIAAKEQNQDALRALEDLKIEAGEYTDEQEDQIENDRFREDLAKRYKNLSGEIIDQLVEWFIIKKKIVKEEERDLEIQEKQKQNRIAAKEQTQGLRREMEDLLIRAGKYTDEQVKQIENDRIREDYVKRYPNLSGKVIDGLIKQREETEKIEERAERINEIFSDSIKDGIAGLINGTKSWGDILLDIGGRILNKVIDQLSEAASINVTGGSGGGGGGDGIFGFVRNVIGFADGGVVTEPTAALIGEGRYNEAVVPLPDGRSIPVELRGAQGAQGQQNRSPDFSSISELRSLQETILSIAQSQTDEQQEFNELLEDQQILNGQINEDEAKSIEQARELQEIYRKFPDLTRRQNNELLKALSIRNQIREQAEAEEAASIAQAQQEEATKQLEEFNRLIEDQQIANGQINAEKAKEIIRARELQDIYERFPNLTQEQNLELRKALIIRNSINDAAERAAVREEKRRIADEEATKAAQQKAAQQAEETRQLTEYNKLLEDTQIANGQISADKAREILNGRELVSIYKSFPTLTEAQNRELLEAVRLRQQITEDAEEAARIEAEDTQEARATQQLQEFNRLLEDQKIASGQIGEVEAQRIIQARELEDILAKFPDLTQAQNNELTSTLNTRNRLAEQAAQQLETQRLTEEAAKEAEETEAARLAQEAERTKQQEEGAALAREFNRLLQDTQIANGQIGEVEAQRIIQARELEDILARFPDLTSKETFELRNALNLRNSIANLAITTEELEANRANREAKSQQLQEFNRLLEDQQIANDQIGEEEAQRILQARELEDIIAKFPDLTNAQNKSLLESLNIRDRIRRKEAEAEEAAEAKRIADEEAARIAEEAAKAKRIADEEAAESLRLAEELKAEEEALGRFIEDRQIALGLINEEEAKELLQKREIADTLERFPNINEENRTLVQELIELDKEGLAQLREDLATEKEITSELGKQVKVQQELNMERAGGGNAFDDGIPGVTPTNRTPEEQEAAGRFFVDTVVRLTKFVNRPLGTAVERGVNLNRQNRNNDRIGKRQRNNSPSPGGGSPSPDGGTGPRSRDGKFFATGGIVRRETRAIIGEAGPEAVVPLSGGRSIPVTIEGGRLGSTVTVNITQNFEGTITPDDAQEAARAAAREVQRALLPGGIGAR